MSLFLKFFKKKSKFEDTDSVYIVAWKNFLRKKINVFFLCLLVMFIFVSIAGYHISPDSTKFANTQYLELTLQKPGFSVQMLKVSKNEKYCRKNFFNEMFFGKTEKFKTIPVYSVRIKEHYVEFELYTGLYPNDGMIEHEHIINIIEPIDTLYPIIYKSNMYFWKTIDGQSKKIKRDEAIYILNKKHVVKQKYILGTDRFGRDVLSQLIIGARVSLAVGFISVIIAMFIGVTIGSIAGYYGGRIDNIIIWLINVIWAIPTLFLVIAITFALGKGFWQIFIAVGLTLWVEIARLIRGLVKTIRNREYIEAAYSMGFSDRRIIFNHILPATLGPMVVVAASNFATAILIESGLSFLGIGIQPPMPSWGSMLRENYGFLIMDYAYLAIFPGLAIMLLVLTFMIIGNGLRDAMDVKDIRV